MKLTDAKIRARCKQFITDSRQHTILRNQKDRAEQYQDFFRGGLHQWTEEEYNVYKSRGVNPITINRCKPVVKALVGMYLQGRQQVRVSPRKAGSATVAQVHTETLKHTQDVSYADYVYTQVFMRGSIDTEAYLKYEVDKTANVNGQPMIKGLSLWDVRVDRNAVEYDLNESARYVIERKWRDKDELEAEYPEKDEQIKRGMDSADFTIESMANRLATYLTSESGADSYDEDDADQVPDTELMRKYRYLVHHVYWKEIVPAIVVHDRQTRQMAKITDEKKVRKLSRKAKKSVRFVIVNFAEKVLHETIMLGEQMLEDVPNPMGEGVSDYPIVRFSPMWDEGYAVGVLDDVVSLNKEENIHRTQTIRILNQTANSGFFVGSMPAAGSEWATLLKNFGSVPGICIPKDKYGGFVEKIQPNPLPQGHFTLGMQFEQDIKRVSGVDDATQGYTTGQTESGRAINLKMQNNRVSNETVFDNFYRSLEIFGNLMLKCHLANDYYTDEEIKQIVSESTLIDPKLMAKAKAKLTGQLGADLPRPMPLPPMDPGAMAAVRPEDQPRVLQMVRQGAQAAQQYMEAFPQLNTMWEQVIKEEAIEMLLAELREDKGMYGVKVVVSPSAPTERLNQFMQMDALMKNYGPIIPADLFIELTDLPQKEQIKERLMQQQAMPMPRPAAKGAA